MTNEIENRIAQLRQRNREAQESHDNEASNDPFMMDLAVGIRSMLDDDFISQVGARPVAAPQASEVPRAAEDVALRQQLLGEQIQANETLLRQQARWAWLALGGACLVAVVILVLAIWGATSVMAHAATEADMIRASNVAELAEARESGQRAIAALHEELASQRHAAEQQIVEAGAELAGLTAERDTVRGELEHFIELRQRLGIRLVETRGQSVIVVREGQTIRPWRVAALHEMAHYNGQMYRVAIGD